MKFETCLILCRDGRPRAAGRGAGALRMRHTPCGCCPPDNTAEYFDYLAGLSKYASASRFLVGSNMPCTNQPPGMIQEGGISPLLGRFKGIPTTGLPRESSEAIRAGKGGTTKRTRPAACGGARDVEFVPTQIPLCHSFFRPSTALSFSYEKESAVESFPARYACGFLRPPGVNPASPARQTLCLRHR